MAATHSVTPGEAGARLDVFLASRLAESSSQQTTCVTRSQIKLAIDAGAALVDGAVGRAGQKLRAGQVVEFTPPPPEPTTVVPEEIPLVIVYEDDYLVVVDKPPGLVVHPSAGHATGTLVAALLAHCRLGGGEDMRPGIVHRIDKDTSGLLVVTKDVRTHEGLARQFRAHTIGRRYLALVRGAPRPDAGRIVTSFGRHPRNRLKFTGKHGGERTAVTRYEVLERFAGAASLVACELETGRTHQVRVHLSELGHPVLGDALYGGSASGDRRLREALAGLTRQALHATRLAFDHPVSGARIDLEAPPPQDFADALAALRGLA